VESLNQFPFLPVFLLVVVSGFFSSSETALFSLTRFQLRQIKARSPGLFLKIQQLLNRPAALVATVLIGNECANVLMSNLFAGFFDKVFAGHVLLVTVVTLITVTPIIFIFGEITPKILAARSNTKIATFNMPILWFFYNAIFPLRWCIESIVNLLTINIRKTATSAEPFVREEDFLHLVEDIKNKGAIEKSEQDLIENVFDLDDDSALESSTPLKDFLSVNENENVASVIQKLKISFAPRIPVLNASEKVVGILYAKDLLIFLDRETSDTKVRQLMKAPLFVDSHMKIDALFKRLRQMKVHIAIIEDSHGNALGVVTMEEVLEQMFGELWERDRKLVK
jgi:putative hemolysin